MFLRQFAPANHVPKNLSHTGGGASASVSCWCKALTMRCLGFFVVVVGLQTLIVA